MAVDPDDPGEIDSDDRSEAIDEGNLGEEYPPDEPLAVDDYGTTPAEERVPEPIGERVERDEADIATEKEAPAPAEEVAMHEERDELAFPEE